MCVHWYILLNCWYLVMFHWNSIPHKHHMMVCCVLCAEKLFGIFGTSFKIRIHNIPLRLQFSNTEFWFIVFEPASSWLYLYFLISNAYGCFEHIRLLMFGHDFRYLSYFIVHRIMQPKNIFVYIWWFTKYIFSVHCLQYILVKMR